MKDKVVVKRLNVLGMNSFSVRYPWLLLVIVENGIGRKVQWSCGGLDILSVG